MALLAATLSLHDAFKTQRDTSALYVSIMKSQPKSCINRNLIDGFASCSSPSSKGPLKLCHFVLTRTKNILHHPATWPCYKRSIKNTNFGGTAQANDWGVLQKLMIAHQRNANSPQSVGTACPAPLHHTGSAASFCLSFSLSLSLNCIARGSGLVTQIIHSPVPAPTTQSWYIGWSPMLTGGSNRHIPRQTPWPLIEVSWSGGWLYRCRL